MNRFSPVRLPLSRPVKFGDTSHGLYSAATGQITTPTPDAVQIACPGVQPLGTDSFVLRIPGTPAVPERTPEEIAADDAAGRTWINYGIIAGFNRRLYGAALSDTSLSPAQGWIYVDDDGDRWMVRISFADFSVLRLRFRRFGRFEHGLPVGDIVQTVEIPVSGLQLSTSTTPEFIARAFGNSHRTTLDAISSSGHRVVVLRSILEWNLTNNPSERRNFALNNAEVYLGHPEAGAPMGLNGCELRLSGKPPFVSVTAHPILEPVTTGASVPTTCTWWSIADYVPRTATANPGEGYREAIKREYGITDNDIARITAPLGTTSVSYTYRSLAGCYYDASDSLQVVTLEIDVTATRTMAAAFSAGSPSSETPPVAGQYADLIRAMSDWPGLGKGYAETDLQITGSARFSSAPGITIPFSQRYRVRACDDEALAPGVIEREYSVGGISGSVSEATGYWGFKSNSGPLLLLQTTDGWGAINPQGGDAPRSSAGPLLNGYPQTIYSTLYPIFPAGCDLKSYRFGSGCWGAIVLGLYSTPVRRLALLGSPLQAKLMAKDGAVAADFGWAGSDPVTGEIVDGDTARCFL